MLQRMGKPIIGPGLGGQAEVPVHDGTLALRQDDGEPGPLGLVLEQREHTVHGEVLDEGPVGGVVLALQGLVRHRAGHGHVVVEVGQGQHRGQEPEQQPHLVLLIFCRRPKVCPRPFSRFHSRVFSVLMFSALFIYSYIRFYRVEKGV